MADRIIAHLTDRLERLPGLGRKSAKRLAHHIINMSDAEAEQLAQAILLAKKTIHRCEKCGNYAEAAECPICSDKRRDHRKVMVVGNVRDVDTFESANCYDGLYFVLREESINPLKGIGPEEIGARELAKRLDDPVVEEVILALSSTLEAEQTALYLRDLVKEKNKRVSMISQGIPVGGVLEYYDALTITRALEGRKEI